MGLRKRLGNGKRRSAPSIRIYLSMSSCFVLEFVMSPSDEGENVKL